MTTLETQPAAAPDDADMLRDYLRGRSAPCPNCRYDLRDLTGHTCPECGEPLILRVGLVEPKIVAFIAGIVALSASTGFSALLIIYALVFERPPSEFWPAILIPAAVSAAVLIAWLRARQRLRALSVVPRLFLVAGCWLLPLANITWFGVIVS